MPDEQHNCGHCGGDDLCPICGDVREIFLGACRPGPDCLLDRFEEEASRAQANHRPSVPGVEDKHEREKHRRLANEHAGGRPTRHDSEPLLHLCRFVERGEGPLADGVRPDALAEFRGFVRDLLCAKVKRDGGSAGRTFRGARDKRVDFLTPEARAALDEAQHNRSEAEQVGLLGVEHALARFLAVPGPNGSSEQPTRLAVDLEELREAHVRPASPVRLRLLSRRTRVLDQLTRVMAKGLAIAEALEAKPVELDEAYVRVQNAFNDALRRGADEAAPMNSGEASGPKAPQAEGTSGDD